MREFRKVNSSIQSNIEVPQFRLDCYPRALHQRPQVDGRQARIVDLQEPRIEKEVKWTAVKGLKVERLRGGSSSRKM